MAQQILFDPLLAMPLIYGLAALTLLIVGVSIWRGLRGWPFRLAAGACFWPRC
jgi:hypothetical protein